MRPWPWRFGRTARKMCIRDSSEVEPQTVSVHMSWLRAKVEDDPAHPAHFKTVRGRGYCFDAAGGAS